MFSCIIKHILWHFIICILWHALLHFIHTHALHALFFLENVDPSIPESEGDPEAPHLCEPVQQGKQLSILIPLV